MHQLSLKLHPKATRDKCLEMIPSLSLDDDLKTCLIDALKMIEDLELALREKSISNSRLQDLVFGPKTEKSANTLFDDDIVDSDEAMAKRNDDDVKPDPVHNSCSSESKISQQPESHAASIESAPSADKISNPVQDSKPRKSFRRSGRRRLGVHATLERHCKVEGCTAGSPCPSCNDGKLYQSRSRSITVLRTLGLVVGETVTLENLRCPTCDHSEQAPEPEDVKNRYGHYHHSLIALLCSLRYMGGMPSYRMERFSNDLKLRIPETTQFRLFEFACAAVIPIYRRLLQAAADSVLTFRDDSPNRILDHVAGDGERKAITTTHIHAENADGEKIALYFTNSKHAGETLDELLMARIASSRMLAIADGLAANRKHSKGEMILEGGCNMHARRYFHELRAYDPEDVRVVLRIYRKVYKNEVEFKKLSPEERLFQHQMHTKPLMDELYARAKRRVAELMPNLSLHKAYKYLLNHWDRLTLFLTEPGVPLDNGEAERGLKSAILHRKNSLFYKTGYGAWVGDVLMSVLLTARLNGLNPVQWLEGVLNQRLQVKMTSQNFMPFSKNFLSAA